MKELYPAIISAVDLDVPREHLMFSIVQQPQHGSIMSLPHGNNVTLYKRGSEIPVEHFTMDDLRNGTKKSILCPSPLQVQIVWSTVKTVL